jgi:hypothetical protein
MSSLWEFIRDHWLGLVVAATGLWAAIAVLKWVMFKFSKRIWFRAFHNRPPTYACIVKGFETRLKRLEDRERELNETLNDKDEPVGASVSTLTTS